MSEDLFAETRFRELVEQLPGITIVYDLSRGTLVYVSPQTTAITGLDVESWLSGGLALWRELQVGPSDSAGEWEAAAGRGEPFDGEFALRNVRDGSVRWIRYHDSPVAGSADLRQGFAQDVTEHVAAHERLGETERLYRTLVEQIPLVVYRDRRHADGRVEPVYVSPQIGALFGYRPEEWLTAVDFQIERIHPEDRARMARDGTLALLEGGETVSARYRFRRRDGSWSWVEEESVTVADAEGRPVWRQGVLRDVTALRRAEERSREVSAALIAAAEAEQARIATELHDDTVQVLTALHLQLDVIAHEKGDERLVRLRDALRGALDRTRRLMFELRPQILEREGLAAALAEVAADGPWERATVDVRVGRQSAHVEALAFRAIRELIVNARKHSRASAIFVTGRVTDAGLEFEVTDDGVGFDVEEALDRDRMRLHIGLDATSERIRLAGGSFRIEARPGAGARFRICLPAEPRVPESV